MRTFIVRLSLHAQQNVTTLYPTQPSVQGSALHHSPELEVLLPILLVTFAPPPQVDGSCFLQFQDGYCFCFLSLISLNLSSCRCAIHFCIQLKIFMIIGTTFLEIFPHMTTSSSVRRNPFNKSIRITPTFRNRPINFVLSLKFF